VYRSVVLKSYGAPRSSTKTRLATVRWALVKRTSKLPSFTASHDVAGPSSMEGASSRR
jgi:hypothetical protein